MILKQKFYQRDTLKVAKELLGCILVRKLSPVKSPQDGVAKGEFNRVKPKIIKAVITETEAYKGKNDLASHASRGRTPRTELMFGEAGRAYIYLIYGMYHCLNIVTEKKDYPAAVLIRGVEIIGSPTSKRKSDFPKLNGPGKVCREMKVDKKLNGWDLTKGEKIWIERGIKISPKDIKKAKRIGVDYAKHCKDYLWRLSLISK